MRRSIAGCSASGTWIIANNETAAWKAPASKSISVMSPWTNEAAGTSRRARPTCTGEMSTPTTW